MDCDSFKNCSAPLCPLDEDSLKSEWYPLEDICKKFSHSWIKAQRKITKKAKDDTTYFTYEMLNRNCKIHPGIKGLDPEKDREVELKNWLIKHKPKKELTEAEKEVIKARLQRKTA